MAARVRAGPGRPNGGAIRYAVLGLGYISQTAVLPAFEHAARNSTLAALVSGNSRKLQTLGRRYGVRHLYHYDQLDELYGSGEIDAVYIALPNSLHQQHAIRAARAHLHVLCEKPMALTSSECDRMIRAARDANVKLMIAYRLHFERTNLEVAEIARSGRLGDLRYFSAQYAMQVAPGNIRLKRDLGGGPLYDIGIYCINAARTVFAAEPVEVWATAASSGDPRFREVPETVVGVMRFPGDRLASFTCSFGSAFRSVYELIGTNGSLIVDPAYEFAEGLSYRLRIDSRTRERRNDPSDQFAPELLYFSDCIINDRAPEPSGEEGLADVRVIEAMHRSMRTARWVTLDLPEREQRPSLAQEIRRPPVEKRPRLVDAAAPQPSA